MNWKLDSFSQADSSCSSCLKSWLELGQFQTSRVHLRFVTAPTKSSTIFPDFSRGSVVKKANFFDPLRSTGVFKEIP